MKTTRQARREARQLFRSCLSNDVLDENRARVVLQYVEKNKPRGYMGIIGHFYKLTRLYAASRAAKVESAVPLTPEFQTGVQADLEKLYGKGLNYTFAQKPQLLGGLRIQVGGDVYDGSVLARLNALRESF